MKVLFAVNDENISTEVVKKYQKEYKEIISYKNVYFYNAILKELQRDKSYDRIVISEDLEEFTSSSYEQRDKFIFDKLDEISDEAIDGNQENIDIILIGSERRSKADDILVKLFGIGIYNAIIGNDRSIDEVCKLINRPRSKKQAKVYYNIESDEINYKPENENDVDEDEMRNILNHFKKLGKNEDKYVQSFNNIVSQYNENQLKIIISMLPLNVKAVLEEKSPEYQKIATSNGLMSKVSARKKLKDKTGPSEKLLMQDTLNKTSKPVVVPTTMKSSNIKRVLTKNIKSPEVSIQDDFEDEDYDEYENENENYNKEKYDISEEKNKIEDEFNDTDEIEKIDIEEKPRKRGRPRKQPVKEEITEVRPKKRGRPRKQKEEQEEELLSGVEENNQSENILPGFDDEDSNTNENILPGFDEVENDETNESILPGFENIEEGEEKNKEEYDDNSNLAYQNNYTSNMYSNLGRNSEEKDYLSNFNKMEYQRLLTPEKKVITFVGTSKNGTSFIVNNVAEYLSKLGVNVALLDATKNKNAYYIYTKNEENLRKTAANCFQNLILGNAYGVQTNPNLTVYTGLPMEKEQIKNYGPILETLVKNHTCVLIDCDYDTPIGYFENAQEIYLVQSMDILTIQPLTAFLRELKSKNVLDESKIRIVINKYLRLKGVASKNIIGGMAFYNDPEMSFMTELFDRNNVQYTEVPFNEEVYVKYLSGIAECDISSNNYPKEFKNVLNNLSSKVYQLAPRQAISGNKKDKAKNDQTYVSSFSSSMNNTLNNMRKKY